MITKKRKRVDLNEPKYNSFPIIIYYDINRNNCTKKRAEKPFCYANKYGDMGEFPYACIECTRNNYELK